MNVIVVGCGRVGAELATALVADGHTVTVIDKARRAFRRLPDDWVGPMVQGLGFDRATLERAGIRSADAVAAVTSGDNSNVLTARIAREHYEVKQVVARIYDPHRAVIYQRLGIATVATVTWTTDQIRRRLLPEQAPVDWSDPTGDLLLVERLLPDAWAGRRLADLSGSDRLRVSAVARAGVPLLVGPATIGHEGDMLYVLVHRDALEVLEATLSDEGVTP
jgi:trk system potassium uptake protein TrkA